MWKKILIVLLIIIVVGGGFLFYRKATSSKTAMTEATLVNTQTAKKGNIVTKVSADGDVRIEDEKEIKARISSTVKEVSIEVGDKVQKGDRLITLNRELLENQLESTRLTLEEAEKNYEILLDTYQNQDKVNNLNLQESRRNLDIAELSYQKEKLAMEDKKEQAVKRVQDTKEALAKAKENYEKQKHLFEKGGIPRQELERAEEALENAWDNYQQAQEDSKILVEETIPNSLELARLKVENARNQLELLKESIKSDRINENDLELAEIKVEKAKKQMEEIKRDLAKAIIMAPVEGTVTALTVNEGDVVTEGKTLCAIGNLNDLIVEVMVDEIDINEVHAGQKAVITSDAFEEELEGKITWVSPVGVKVGNINKYKTRIKVKETKGLLRPGMFVNAEIITNKASNVVLVPVMALQGGGEKYVFVLEDGKAVKKPVETGLKNLSHVEVKGIQEGEKIIVGPFRVLQSLKPGMPVKDMTEKAGVKSR